MEYHENIDSSVMKEVLFRVYCEPESFLSLPTELRENEHFQQKVVERNPKIFRYLENPSDDVKMAAVSTYRCINMNNYHPLQDITDPWHELLIAAVENSPIALKYIQNQSLDVIKRSIEIWPESLEYVIEQTTEICWLALTRTNYILSKIKNPSYEMCLFAVETNPYSIINVPDEHKTTELCWIVINSASSSLLNHIPNPSNDMIEATLSKDGKGIAHISILNADFCAMAVQTTKSAIKYVPRSFLTEEMCWQALYHNVNLFDYTWKTKDMCEYVLKYNGYLIASILDPTEDLCIQAVTTSPFALKYIQDQTNDVIMAALSVTGMAIKYVTHQTDELCMIAVARDGTALNYVRNKTREICLKAFETDGYALDCLPAKERTKELCVVAVAQNVWAINLVPEGIDITVPQEIDDIMNLRVPVTDTVILKHPWCMDYDLFTDIDFELIFSEHPRLMYYLDDEFDVVETIGCDFFTRHPGTIYYLDDRFVEEHVTYN